MIVNAPINPSPCVGEPFRSREETKIDGDRITSRGHSISGSRMAREILWKSGIDFDRRERICALIRHHQAPLHLLDQREAEKRIIWISQTAICSNLALLAKSDALGRTCDDQDDILEKIELFSECCREPGCLDKPFSFASDHSRFIYFSKGKSNPNYEAFDDTRSKVTIMSGLPASGKDYWISKNRTNANMISLDSIRTELRIPPGGPQGKVIEQAKEQAKQYLRKGDSFVWNATNTSRDIRSRIISLCADYKAKIEIVYLETTYNEQMTRNNKREHPVPKAAIQKMLRTWEPPSISEVHSVQYIISTTE